MTKKDYELIAEAIADEARPAISNIKMYKHTDPERAQRECGLDSQLQALWSVSLAIRNRLLRYPNFNEQKFLKACGTSPQNWRYMSWVDGKYINTFDAEDFVQHIAKGNSVDSYKDN